MSPNPKSDVLGQEEIRAFLRFLSLGPQPHEKNNATTPEKWLTAHICVLNIKMAAKLSPFLCPSTVSQADQLAIVYLRRDQQTPTILKNRDDDDEGYAEGKVVNTRFGSFPHNTLIGLPWGSQVRASKVDTGSRGRRNLKRNREDSEAQETPDPADDGSAAAKQAVTASSGFIHLLAPTPENWTSSLPHRTQVVYTPDYSYILHRIRARPGSRLIEAGAGSGSFTHASTRAVYSGYPSPEPSSKKRKLGKVYSYEFHEQRHEKLVKELGDHGLDGIVQITHRDVCADGFLVGENKDETPGADAVFLDLPAPWLALPHLSRRAQAAATPPPAGQESPPFVSALNPNAPVNICTFSPCIEQVQRTISAMRKLGWVQISMVEVQHKRLEIRRERIGIVHGQVAHGVQNAPASVGEALARLKEVEGRFRTFHGSEPSSGGGGEKNDEERPRKRVREQPNSKQAIMDSLIEKKVYKEGNLIHKTEPDVKTHTSYLVFAVLPIEWTEEDELKAAAEWPAKALETGKGKEEVVKPGPISRRQAKRDEKAEKARIAAEKAENGVEGNVENKVAEESAVIEDAMVE